MADTDNTDFQQVQALIKGEVERYAAEAFAKQQTPAQQQTEQQQAQKQLHDLINPFVEPGVNEAKFTAADAKDYVDFYTGNTDYLDYKQQVEDTFKEAKNNGHPLPRADIISWLLGKEYKSDPAKFTEKQQAKQKEQLARASVGADFGAGALDRAKADTTFANFGSLTSDEMEKIMDGVTF